MIMKSSVAEGRAIKAMRAVIPEVPDMMRPRRNLLAPWRHRDPAQNTAVRDKLAATARLDPADYRHRLPLDKLELYTLLAAVGQHMAPIMVEGIGPQARFVPLNNPQVYVPADSPTYNLRPYFNQGHDTLAAANPWVGQIDARVQETFRELQRQRRARDSDDANSSLRNMVSGGALGTTLQELAALAYKQQQQTEGPLAESADKQQVEAYLRRRVGLMHHLGYLGISQAGLNIDLFGLYGLGTLKGELRTITQVTDAGERAVTVFQKDRTAHGKEAWDRVFPSPTSPVAVEPTYKCPFHEPLANLIPAGINLVAESGVLQPDSLVI